MSSESSFTRRSKSPSPAFVLVIVITIVGLVISFALPSLVLPRFSNDPTVLVFQVRVIDDRGLPIPGARVFVVNASAQTDKDGYAEVKQRFMAKGVKGLSGTCRLEGELRVESAGYIPWKGTLNKLFGRNYNYFDKGSTIPYEVTLRR